MNRIIEYETAVDGIEFGFWPDEGAHDEGELHEVIPTNEFERACVDTIDTLRLTMRAELIELAERIEALEAGAGDGPCK